jgi:hypothetical protein
MNITIEINTDSFEEHAEIEVRRILRQTADYIFKNGLHYLPDYRLKDINGNHVGNIILTN